MVREGPNLALDEIWNIIIIGLGGRLGLGGLLKVGIDKLREIVIVCSSAVATGLGEVGVDLLQIIEVVSAQLVDDAGEEILQLLVLSVTADDVSVGSNRCLHLGIREMDDGSVFLEQIDLFNGGDVTHVKLVQCALDTFVINNASFTDGLVLSSHRALATGAGIGILICELFELLGIERHLRTFEVSEGF